MHVCVWFCADKKRSYNRNTRRRLFSANASASVIPPNYSVFGEHIHSLDHTYTTQHRRKVMNLKNNPLLSERARAGRREEGVFK